MTAALIIASGKTNTKTAFEPAKMIGSITAVERIAILLQQAGIQRIAVVCSEDDKIRKLHTSANLTFLTAPSDGEMLDSIKIGLTYLRNKCTEALIVYVDIPMFSVHTVHKLMQADGDVCIPSYHGRWGHPILLRADHFAQILAYQGDNGLRGAIEAANINKRILEVEDAGIRADIQRDLSYQKLITNHDAAKMRLTCQFGIAKERVFYDGYVHQLLSLMEELGSLSKACTHMGISLNKGRAIIATIEQQIEHPVLETQQGGKHGGYSRLTAEMKSLLADYDSFCAEAETYLQQLFQKYFLHTTDK